ncbi:hypothetical protein BDV93DRAFT_81082 [Ceratobasidium sp. AG-I]|nr:hypothetical protein BDV93DRAFT_81082 [Ceratobasidium sp. AG-I]
MSTSRALNVTGNIALELLRVTAASADVFPPLKSVAGGVLHVAEIIEKFHSNKEEWKEFADYVQNSSASIIDCLSRADPSQTDLKVKLATLHSTMVKTITLIEAKRDRPTYKRLYEARKDPDRIASMRRTLEEAIGLFASRRSRHKSMYGEPWTR